MSRITLVTRGDDQVLEQITKQLNKLVHVIKVIDFKGAAHVERELVLIKVTADERTRGEVMNIVDIFRAKIIDVASKSYIIEVTGAEEKIDGDDRAADSRSASWRSRARVVWRWCAGTETGGARGPSGEREGGMNIYYEKDADLERPTGARRSRSSATAARGTRTRSTCATAAWTCASGCVATAARWQKAEGAGLTVGDADAATWGDIVMMLVPDESARASCTEAKSRRA